MSDLIAQQFFTQLDNSNLNKEQIDSARKKLDQVNSIMESFRNEKNLILNSGDLTGKGKQTQIAQLSTNAGERLENVISPELKALDARIMELTEQTRPQSPSSDALLEHMRQTEIRNKLYKMDPLEVLAIYEDLAVSGLDDLTMRAIEGAPASFKLVSDPTVLESGMRARGERQSPDSAKTLTQLKQWRATLEGSLNSAKSELNLPDLKIVNIAKTGTV